MNRKRQRTSSVVNNPVKIIIKPSTELIPDEYEHDNIENACIHIFKSSSIKEKCEETFVETMESLNFRIPKENFHAFDQRKDVFDALEKIKSGITNESMLIIVVYGFYEESKPNAFKLIANNEIEFMTIWDKFTTRNCQKLRNKPRIFLFQVKERATQTDVVYDSILTPYRKRFDMPAETDILVVYNKMTDNHKSRFLDQFCENVKRYGRMEDIVTLLTYTEIPYQVQPIILSTLTRKLYLNHCNFRGNHLELTEHSDSLSHKMKEAHSLLDKMHEVGIHSKEQQEEYGELEKIYNEFYSDDSGTRTWADILATEVCEADDSSSNFFPNMNHFLYSVSLYLNRCYITVKDFVRLFVRIIVIVSLCMLFILYLVMV